MLCPHCASSLPDGTDSCLHCGTPSVPAAPLQALCAACGDPCDSEFCDSCEKALLGGAGLMQVRFTATSNQPSSLTASIGAEEMISSPAIEELQKPPHPSPPYANFVVVTLVFLLCVSMIAFAAADDVARGHFYFAPLIFFCALTALMLAVWPMHITYAALKRSEAANPANKDLPRARGKLRSRSMFFGALFTLTAALVGYLIGASGAATQKLVTDFRRFNEIGDRITEMRSSADSTLTSQLAIYEELSAPVKEFREVAKEVRAELGPYDEKYPISHERTKQWMDAMDAAIHRSDLIEKEIEVAKRISRMPPGDQDRTWQAEMQPLLEEEDAISPSDD